MCVCFLFLFSQGGRLVGLMPVLAACHLIYVFSIVLHCDVIHVVANKVTLSLSPSFSNRLVQLQLMLCKQLASSKASIQCLPV